MSKVIDEKGRIFGKVNVIDFLVVLVMVILIPVFYFGQKIIRASYKDVALYDVRDQAPNYTVERKCPNCGSTILLHIKKGTPMPEFLPYQTICPFCKVKVTIKQ